jgi:hypothetical protein
MLFEALPKLFLPTPLPLLTDTTTNTPLSLALIHALASKLTKSTSKTL